MPITYSKSVLKQIKGEKISWDEIDSALVTPDSVSHDHDGNTIAQKRVGQNILRIVYKMDAGSKNVLKAHKSIMNDQRA
nr:hypothetical protein [Candidatus Sigynarchaeota archaeon]